MGMAYAAVGDYTNAVRCARKALELTPASKGTNAALLQSRLELYQKHQPWRECFRQTNAPPVPTKNVE